MRAEETDVDSSKLLPRILLEKDKRDQEATAEDCSVFVNCCCILMKKARACLDVERKVGIQKERLKV